jgi:hypothetical protein
MSDSVQQSNEILAAFAKLDPKDQNQRKALAKQIAGSSLPRYHKEVLQAVFLESDENRMVSVLYLLKQQEIHRHADALLKFEQRIVMARYQKKT